MQRRPVTLRDSLGKAMGGPGGGGDLSLPVAIWYWIVGEPVADDETEGEE